MARESKAVFKMAGYTYPGTSPVTKKAGPEPQQIDVDDLMDEEEEKKDSEEVKASLWGAVVGGVKNIGAKGRMKKRTN